MKFYNYAHLIRRAASGLTCSLSLIANAAQHVDFCGGITQIDRPSKAQLRFYLGPPAPPWHRRHMTVHDAVSKERSEVLITTETVLLEPDEDASLSDGHHVSCNIHVEQKGSALVAQFKLYVCLPSLPCTTTIREFEFATVDE